MLVPHLGTAVVLEGSANFARAATRGEKNRRRLKVAGKPA
jgi:hypothetical protein